MTQDSQYPFHEEEEVITVDSEKKQLIIRSAKVKTAIELQNEDVKGRSRMERLPNFFNMVTNIGRTEVTLSLMEKQDITIELINKGGEKGTIRQK